MMVKFGHGQYDSKEDAFAVLEKMHETGHFNHTTNVKKEPKYLCNCHKDWCAGVLGYHATGRNQILTGG